MGRPRKSEPRDQQLNLSLTASELESIKRRAQAVGMRPVHFGRALLLDENRKITFRERRSRRQCRTADLRASWCASGII